MKSIFSPTNFINIFSINLRNGPFTEIRDLTIINIVIFFIYYIRRTTSPGADRRVGSPQSIHIILVLTLNYHVFFSQPLHFVRHTLTNLIPLMPYTPSLGSNEPYSLVLGIHFPRVAPTTVRRKHNNEAPKFWVDTDGETKNTTTLSLARKEWL